MAILTDQQIANIAVASGWSGADVAIAVATALAASRGRDDATHHNLNGTTDYGLWQVNSVHLQPGGILTGVTTQSLLNGATNGKHAHTVYAHQGWNAWAEYKSGAYRLFMPRAMKVAPTASASGGGAGDTVVNPSPLDALAKAATVPFRAAAWIGNPHNWARVLEVGTGAALIVTGLAVVASTSKSARTVRKVLP